jgi:RimJ/RimL family protein N-acetyltransferase
MGVLQSESRAPAPSVGRLRIRMHRHPMPRIDLKPAPQLLLTERTRLEVPRAEHAEAFRAGVTATAPVLQYVDWRPNPDLAWARRFCEDDARSVAAGEDLVFHVFQRSDDAWVGRIDVHSIAFGHARGEIGYVGDLRLAGRGLMREAARAVIDLCFRLGFQRIEAMSDVRNLRALRFAEALGMQREGILRRHERDPQGRMCDQALYAALNETPTREP